MRWSFSFGPASRDRPRRVLSYRDRRVVVPQVVVMPPSSRLLRYKADKHVQITYVLLIYSYGNIYVILNDSKAQNYIYDVVCDFNFFFFLPTTAHGAQDGSRF